MKILVFSDSHGSVSGMEQAVEREKPDCIFHLGDGWHDAERLHSCYPDIPMEKVPGNCDFQPLEQNVKLVMAEGKRIVLCHGHMYRVKSGLLDAGYAAREKKADLFLFGHTHVPTQEWVGGSLLLNPGSIGYGRDPSYAVVRIEDGKLSASLRRLT